jgi:hypothetical protein
MILLLKLITPFNERNKMGKEVVNLNVTKTGTHSITVQLDESISLEDLDRIDFENLIGQSYWEGEDTSESEWEEESREGITPDNILCLNESGDPYLQEIRKDE